MSGDERADALIDERELSEALRGLRPEREAFRAGVERRLRELEARPDGQARELQAADGAWWRRAAAWLPGDLVPGALAGTGAKLSWKALPGLLVLPALTFAMLVMPLYVALTTIGTESGARAAQRLTTVRGWWREHKRVALIVLGLIGLLFLREPVSAGVALLLVSTGVLALLLARLRASGFGTRADVGRHCAHLLLALAFCMALFGGPWLVLFPDTRSAQLAFCALALGVAVCAWAALREDYPSFWKLVTRCNAGDAVLLLVMVFLPPWSGMAIWSALVDVPGQESLARRVEECRPTGFEGWERARRTAAFLRSEGAAPELGGLREHWLARRARDEGTAGFLSAGIELGFVEGAELRALAERARSLLSEPGPIRGASLRERGDLLALVRDGSLTSEERDALAARLLASRDAGEQPWVLLRLATVAALLDGLDRAGPADGLRAEAHALLSACWIPPGSFSGKGAGFIARPPSERAFVAHTHDAIELMLRFGVPDGIDLRAVLRGLEHDRRRLPSSEHASLEWDADLAIHELERGLLPARGALALVSANRVLLALLALAGFCVAATLRAPRAVRG